jgi:hypothetical protein
VSDKNRIDDLIAYALAAAGQEDWANRKLGPVHLIKYLYLADLAFAESHGGETFTHVPWRFYHFGPWSEEVYERIEPVVVQIGAIEERFRSKLADDAIRWHLDDSEGLFERLDDALPSEVAQTMKRAIHSFGPDTSDLLHFVYATRPMLRAAPGDLLDFTPEVQEDAERRLVWFQRSAALVAATPSLPAAFMSGRPAPSRSAAKRRAKDLEALGVRIKAKLAEVKARKKLVPPIPEPRFDELFAKGVEWLNEQVGEALRSEQGELTFSPEIWKSRARGEKLS